MLVCDMNVLRLLSSSTMQSSTILVESSRYLSSLTALALDEVTETVYYTDTTRFVGKMHLIIARIYFLSFRIVGAS